MFQVLQNVFRSANNVLERSNRQAWLDLNGRENGGNGGAAGGQMMKVVTQLMRSLEENAFLLASVMNDPEVVLESSDILSKYSIDRPCLRGGMKGLGWK